MVKTKDYEGEDRRSKSIIATIVKWILGIVSAMVIFALSSVVTRVYGSLDIHSQQISEHAARIGKLEECAARNYDYLKKIDTKTDRLIAMHMKDDLR